MNEISISDIVRITGGKVFGSDKSEIVNLVTDSRSLVKPEGALFVALKGQRSDGHLFLRDLYDRRLFRHFLVSELPAGFELWEGAVFVLVPDTLKALHSLAEYRRSCFDGKVLAITGSNGKTIVKEWLFQLLEEDVRIVRSPKSYNSQLGVPLSLWLLKNKAEWAFIEAGISQPGEMEKLQRMIKPEVGIFTNIGAAHQENFSSMSEKVSEKLKLFNGVECLIYCSDYELVHSQVQQMLAQKQIASTSTWSRHQSADLQIAGIHKSEGSTRIDGIYKEQSLELNIPFIDEASIENAIHCWLFMLWQGYSQSKIVKRMQELLPVAMRLELKKGINNCTLINDTYNSDLQSLAIALDFLHQQTTHPSSTLILSDIFQSGKDEEQLYTEVASLVNQKKITRFIGIGSALFKYQHLFKTNVGNAKGAFYLFTEDLIRELPHLSFSNEAILLKGSRQFEFERLSAVLSQKTHRTVLEINMNALTHNYNHFKSLLKPETKTMIMVKAFSYGSGSVEVARLMQFLKADYLAVAIADEGVELRQQGITLPILVMNPEEGSYDLMIQYELEPEIYNFRTLTNFTQALAHNKVRNFPVHIKFDTGMHRLGFLPNELQVLASRLKSNPWIRVSSVFTHLAAADDRGQDEFTRHQIARFSEMSAFLANIINEPFMKHVLNSSGIERFPEAQFDMVRLGIGLYGISCVDQRKLQHISTLKSSISQIKTIAVGETIGYGRKGKTGNSEKIIGIIPIGYADGLNRKLSNGVGRFMVKGVSAPIIGTICMDMSMIDLTGVEAKEGDEVVIFGQDPSVIEIAEKLGTIPYEILTSISPRVKRVYFNE